MSQTTNAGIVTAYGAAVRGGYQGTYSDFCTDLANLAQVMSELSNLSATAETLVAGSSATATYANGVFTFGIPRGDKGEKGDTGKGIASVSLLSISGLEKTYRITFTDGTYFDYVVTDGKSIVGTTLNSDYTLTITYNDGTTWTSGSIRGATGATPNLTIGTVTTGAAGTDASASITGTAENPVLNLTIPKGADGDVSSASIASVYNATKTYAVGDYVWYSGQLYKCTTEIATAEAWTAAHWTAVKIADDVKDLKSSLKYATGNTYVQLINGYFVRDNYSVGTVVDYDNPLQGASNNNYAVLDAEYGDVFIINGTGGGQGRLWCFVDSDKKLISVATAGAIADNLRLIAPENASKIILNVIGNQPPTSFIGESAISKIQKTKSIIDTGYEKQWNPDDMSQGYWSRQSIVADTKRICVSEPYPVAVGDTLRISNNTDGLYFAIGIYVGADIAAYDATGWITATEYDYNVQRNGRIFFMFQTNETEETSTDITPEDMTAEVGVLYDGFIISEINADKANINKLINLGEKTIAFLGDSLTAGVGTNHIYHMYIADRFGWHCKNYGYGGSGYAMSYTGTGGKMATGQEGMGVNITSSTKIIPNDFLSRIPSIDTNVDALVIFGGTNDWGNGGSTITVEQFETAVNAVLNYAQTNFGRIPIIVMLPVHRENDTVVNGQGKTLREYADMIKNICINHGIYCVDMMEKSGLYPDNSNNATLYFTRDDTSVIDGVHPNHYAHKVMANVLSQTLKDLLY